jgi:hypothetical protein
MPAVLEFDEKPENWLPKKLVEMANNPEAMNQAMGQQAEEQKAKEEANNPLFIDPNAEEQPQGQNGQAMPPEAGGGPAVAPSSMPNQLGESLDAMKSANTKAIQG